MHPPPRPALGQQDGRRPRRGGDRPGVRPPEGWRKSSGIAPSGEVRPDHVIVLTGQESAELRAPRTRLTPPVDRPGPEPEPEGWWDRPPLPRALPRSEYHCTAGRPQGRRPL